MAAADRRRDRDQGQLRQLVPPVKGGEQRRRNENQHRARREQQTRADLLVPAARADGEARQGQHEPAREHRPRHG
ncbi:MAG TPA: hypothetical protein VJ254_22085, partial [Streptosporangiaceae bacterium]|nr:hypothetical protein [Streptosporangiaceae bacterium]